MQVLWTRLLTLFFRDTVYDFTLVLAVFLTGLVLGSLACRDSCAAPPPPPTPWDGFNWLWVPPCCWGCTLWPNCRIC